MRELLREIREYLSLSQSEFAERLNVTFATVNRWENGHAMPNRLAQTEIYKLCLKNDVPLYQFTFDRIENEAGTISLPDNCVLLYHGSKSGIKGRIEPKSRMRCDFGKGFYMGTEAAQALTLICDYEDSRLYIVSIDLRNLNVVEIPVSLDWAMVVAYYRGHMENNRGTPLYEKYRNMFNGQDLVIGSIADDRLFYVVDQFFIGTITDAAMVGCLSALQLGKQYVALNRKSCDAVRIEREIEISYLERLCIKDVATERRTKGVLLADKICRDHRREGLFYDEILENGIPEREEERE